ncbi:hypothetical protein ACI2I2_06475 [Scandinavium sp. NPDC088450]|uniref:hypothetical protein n=1 Tax=Scandinavium sp. NPDC088450 TaxID=3364514 RepID=UPI00384CC1F0
MRDHPWQSRDSMSELRERVARIEAITVPDFTFLPTQAFEVRIQAVQRICQKQSNSDVLSYLEGLGFVRAKLLSAREVLHDKGKKRFESFIRSASLDIASRFSAIHKAHIETLKNVMHVPFRRSAAKDLQQISESLCRIADLISSYRYSIVDSKYREFVRTILGHIDTERLPPRIAGLIIVELTDLVEAAVSVNVFKYSGSGLTHEEYWRHVDPIEYGEVYEGGVIPDDATLIDGMDAYSQHEAIAEQSLWYGIDGTVDDFIISTAGGLLHMKRLREPVNNHEGKREE